jgi:hypothetical protein
MILTDRLHSFRSTRHVTQSAKAQTYNIGATQYFVFKSIESVLHIYLAPLSNFSDELHTFDIFRPRARFSAQSPSGKGRPRMPQNLNSLKQIGMEIVKNVFPWKDLYQLARRGGNLKQIRFFSVGGALEPQK